RGPAAVARHRRGAGRVGRPHVRPRQGRRRRARRWRARRRSRQTGAGGRGRGRAGDRHPARGPARTVVGCAHVGAVGAVRPVDAVAAAGAGPAVGRARAHPARARSRAGSRLRDEAPAAERRTRGDRRPRRPRLDRRWVHRHRLRSRCRWKNEDHGLFLLRRMWDPFARWPGLAPRRSALRAARRYTRCMEQLHLHLELLVRILVGTVLGGAIGYERDLRGRPAGLRTHAIVALASATFMVVSTRFFYFQHYGKDDLVAVDPSRIAASVVSGIGFLGAGAILRDGITIKGLTTAAGLWLVAAIGMAAGGGMYVESVFAT